MMTIDLLQLMITMAVIIRCRQRCDRRPSSTEAPWFDLRFASLVDVDRVDLFSGDTRSCCVTFGVAGRVIAYECQLMDVGDDMPELFTCAADKSALETFVDILWLRAEK